MSVLRPFMAVRPTKENAEKVAALPYDVMNSAEAREMVKGNPCSFLHVDKAEIDLPEDTYLYDEKVYLKARENLDKLESDGICNTLSLCLPSDYERQSADRYSRLRINR